MTKPAVGATFEIHGNTVVVHSMWIRDDLRGNENLARNNRWLIGSAGNPAVGPTPSRTALYFPGTDREHDNDAVVIDVHFDETPQEVVGALKSLIAEINEKYPEKTIEEFHEEVKEFVENMEPAGEEKHAVAPECLLGAYSLERAIKCSAKSET